MLFFFKWVISFCIFSITCLMPDNSVFTQSSWSFWGDLRVSSADPYLAPLRECFNKLLFSFNFMSVAELDWFLIDRCFPGVSYYPDSCFKFISSFRRKSSIFFIYSRLGVLKVRISPLVPDYASFFCRSLTTCRNLLFSSRNLALISVVSYLSILNCSANPNCYYSSFSL